MPWSYVYDDSSILLVAARSQKTSLFMVHAQKSLWICRKFFAFDSMNSKGDGRMRSVNTTAHRPSENTY
jgi:hypothetical protein